LDRDRRPPKGHRRRQNQIETKVHKRPTTSRSLSVVRQLPNPIKLPSDFRPASLGPKFSCLGPASTILVNKSADQISPWKFLLITIGDDRVDFFATSLAIHKIFGIQNSGQFWSVGISSSLRLDPGDSLGENFVKSAKPSWSLELRWRQRTWFSPRRRWVFWFSPVQIRLYLGNRFF